MVLRTDSKRRSTRASPFGVRESAPSMILRSVRPRRHVDDLELDPVRILEEHRVVAGGVFREFSRRAVERGQTPRSHEALAESVHLLAPIDAEGEVIQSGSLAMEAAPGEARLGRDEPDVHASIGERGHTALVVDGAPLEIAEEIPVEGQRHARRSHVDLDMVEERRHAYQNFSHLTLLRSMPFLTSTSRTALTVAPPPHTYTTSLSTLWTSRSTAAAASPVSPRHPAGASRTAVTYVNPGYRRARERNSSS